MTRSPYLLALTAASLLWLHDSRAQVPPPAKPAAAAQLPAALAQVPPGTVTSTYDDGKLTVRARNARLIDVLYSACDLIGAQLNAPEDADQPILRAVGPARPRDVLASLLRGSPFNYSISGSANDPNAIASVTVFPKDKKGGKDKEADSASPAQQQLRNLMALAQQAELPDSGTGNATEATGSDTGNADSGSADSSVASQALLKALEANPNLISQIEARVNGDADGSGAMVGTDPNATPAQPPPDVPIVWPQGRRHRH
jgi:hypothetical protein